MMRKWTHALIATTIVCLLQGCSTTKKTTTQPADADNISNSKNKIPARSINTKNVSADSVVQFAETLIGVKYKYGSANRDQGFDCSGFISYVFTHFNIQVPRASIEFTNAGKTVNMHESKKGDLILFTGSDPTGRIVGHMGIITQNTNGKIKFIHSASGNNKGVMISGMSEYFTTRFVKVIRIF